MHDRATADAMAPRDGIVTSAGPRIQQDCRPQRTPFLVASRLADGVQLALFLFGELQGAALPREGHTPLKHNRVEMYRYLENDHLVSATALLGLLTPIAELHLHLHFMAPPYTTFWRTNQ